MKSFLRFTPLANSLHGRRPWVAGVCFTVAVGSLVITQNESNPLAAEFSSGLPVLVDYDGDGLEDIQEYVLGTDPDLRDTDSDGYEDLEEVARGTDPLDPNSIPENEELNIGLYAYTEDDVIHFHAAVYAQGTSTVGLRPEVGMVFATGQRFPFGAGFIGTGTFFSQATSNPSDIMAVIDLPIPESLVRQMGQVNFYGKIQDVANPWRTPASAGTTMVDSSGITMMIQSSPSTVGGGGGGGIIYRPLTGPTVAPPASASTGQVCHQEIAPVGSEGNLLQYEILSGSCEDFDSYCQGNGCSGGAGSGIELVDPGSLLGG